MRAFGKSSFAAALLVFTAGSALAEPNPRGTWMRDDGNARVKIEPCGGEQPDNARLRRRRPAVQVDGLEQGRRRLVRPSDSAF